MQRTIHRGMSVGEIIALLPEAAPLLAEYGLHCSGCAMGGRETLGDGCQMHGFSEEDTNNLLRDLQRLFRSQPNLPQKLVLTEEAARALGKILEENHKEEWNICVDIDEAGKFFLEFHRTVPKGAKTFHHPAVPAVRVLALPLTLRRIGGATVDYRDGRFKLDLPEKKSSCMCKKKT